MDQVPGQETYSRWREGGTGEPCTGCGDLVEPDPVGGGLFCARCGQWHVLCGVCRPDTPEHSPDAVWLCPECR